MPEKLISVLTRFHREVVLPDIERIVTNVKNNQLKYYTMTTHRPSTYSVRRSSPSNTAQSKEETNGTPV